MKRTPRHFVLAATSLIFLAGCSGAAQTQQSPASDAVSAAASHVPGEHGTPSKAADGSTVIDRLGLQGKDAVATIDALDRSDEQRPLDIKASVKADRLVLTDDAGERTLPIPDDKFYLSVAPYLQTTHECFAHSLSGCQGEQAGKAMHITITDEAGEKLVDSDVTTWHNGFIGFWLPRDIKGTVTATMDGRTGTVPFATDADSPTCLTTLQMA